MAVELGLRIQNVLGVFKLFILAIVAATGFVALFYGIPNSSHFVPDRWRGHENFRNIWSGTITNPSAVCLSLYSVSLPFQLYLSRIYSNLYDFAQVIWSFVGFSNANYALAEMRDPARTIRIAGPLAVVVVAAFYIFSNIAYLASASKEEILDSGRLVVSLMMRNIWGERVERWVDFGVACSSLGSVLAMVTINCYLL
jgi:amino acid transporter